jgi:hypothetical protein
VRAYTKRRITEAATDYVLEWIELDDKTDTETIDLNLLMALARIARSEMEYMYPVEEPEESK